MTLRLYKTSGAFIDYSSPFKTIAAKNRIMASETGVTEPGMYYAVLTDKNGKVVYANALTLTSKWIKGKFETGVAQPYETVATLTPVNLKPGSVSFSEILVESNGSVARITAPVGGGSLAGVKMFAALFENGRLTKLYNAAASADSPAIYNLPLSALNKGLELYIWDGVSMEPYIKTETIKIP
jgi:hypothetical protein